LDPHARAESGDYFRESDYQEKFGPWCYAQPPSSGGIEWRFHYGEQFLNTGVPSPRVLGPNDRWFQVEKQILELGLVTINRLVSPNSSLWLSQDFISEMERQLGGKPTEYPLIVPRLNEHLRRECSSDVTFEWLAKIPSTVQEAIDRFVRFVDEPVTDWETAIDELFLRNISTADFSEEMFPAFLECLEFKRSKTLLQKRKLSFECNVDLELLYNFFAIARLRQLRAIRAVMNRVVDFVYSRPEEH
jgi:hypothetical protein